jgi:methanogenic corrinoid protein MtbC1
MRQQPITDDSWTEAEAGGLLRRLSGAHRMRAHEAGGGPSRQAVLARAVRDEVIPRLLMAHKARPARVAAGDGPARVAAGDGPARVAGPRVSRLVSAVLDGSQAEATAYVEALHEAGTGAESLFLDLLAPTARQLGRMWEDDTCTFSDVTLGLMRLANVMRLLSGAFGDDYDPTRAGPSALLAQMPGEQHGFGLAMVVQFFRRDGWNVRQAPAAGCGALVDLVERNWFGVVGISVACDERMEALADIVGAIRRRSRNRHVGVMVGGPPFLAHPQLADMVGADATAADGRLAVQRAHRLVAAQARAR